MKKRDPFSVPEKSKRRCVGCRQPVSGRQHKKLSGNRALCGPCEVLVRQQGTEELVEIVPIGHYAPEEPELVEIEPIGHYAPEEPERCSHGGRAQLGCIRCSLERGEARLVVHP